MRPTTGYLGVTPPITTSGPSKLEENANEELLKEMRAQNIFESAEYARKREQVLEMVYDLVRSFVRRISLSIGLSEPESKAAGGKIFTYGSYRLGVHGPGSDINVLCVVPKHVTYVDIFNTLEPMLKETEGVSGVVGVPGAYVPIIGANIHGIPMHISFGSLNQSNIPEDLELEDDMVLAGIDERFVRSVGGPRATADILQLVPDVAVFRDSLRCIRLWAQRRAIYSSLNGFFGGVDWAILVARVCQLYPKLNAAAIVHRKWPQPILLRKIVEDVKDVDSTKRLNFRVWNPRLYPADRNRLMPIITPAYPSTCSSHRVTRSAMSVMRDELLRGSQVVERIVTKRAQWSELFAKHDFFQKYRYYLQIIASSGKSDDQLRWSSMIQSKLQQLVIKLELVDQLELAHLYTQGFHHKYYCLDHTEVRAVSQGDVSPAIARRKEEDMKDLPGVNETYTSAFYIGMKVADKKAGTSGPRKLDISYPTTEFTKQVKQWNQYNQDTHGIVIRHIKSSALPDHVFDGGVRPHVPKQLKRSRKNRTEGLGELQDQLGRLTLSTS